MSYYLKAGNTFRVTNKEAMDLHEKLPAGNYVIKEDAFGNLYLETIESFVMKGKQYGNLIKNRTRITETFLKRDVSTGVMLSGEKGSGKSLLAKAVCAHLAEKEEIPSIIINTPREGDKFNTFLQLIQQPVVILFDEFEKVYEPEQQEGILTLLDGVFPSKKLFVFTCNDKWRVDQHMRNRPGRIFYMIDFKGLSSEFIREYCQDNLVNKGHIERIVGIGSLFSEFNFDMLKALVEEMNRYDEAPEVALEILNAKPEFDTGKVEYTVDLIINGLPVNPEFIITKTVTGTPLTKPFNIEGYIRGIKKGSSKKKRTNPSTGSGQGAIIDDLGEADEDKYFCHNFTPDDLKKIDTPNKKFAYINRDGVSVILTRQEPKTYHYHGAF